MKKPRIPKAKLPQPKLCDNCEQIMREYRAALRRSAVQSRLNAGLCRDCLNQREPGSGTYCEHHRLKHIEYAKKGR